MTIRQYNTKDIPAILHLEQAYLDSPWSEKVLIETLQNPDTVMLVAEDGGKVIGYGSFCKVVDEAQINNICVDLESRRAGVGGMILDAIEDIATKKGCKELILEVACDNISAIGLYKKHGYTQLYVRPKYYNGTKDAIVMTKQMK
ncbi:MAG: ribosomal protein S18-alanine N-acetyltransferase [Firmicutes bacterium]|nr:ribosomal protein S18-alanine N-acetyltransferase [Bacillota bacterium]